MNHVMIDLETLGTTSRSAIISIGAVQFDIDSGDIKFTFERLIDWESAIRDRHVSGDTIKWWMGQDEVAQARVTKKGLDIVDVINDFIDWLPGQPIVWGNGSSFDISMLEDVMHQYEADIPWKHWNVRDMRTLVDVARAMTKADKDDVEFDGIQHDALHDAVHQANVVSYLWNELKLLQTK